MIYKRREEVLLMMDLKVFLNGIKLCFILNSSVIVYFNVWCIFRQLAASKRGWDLTHSPHKLDLWEITQIKILPGLTLQKNKLD